MKRTGISAEGFGRLSKKVAQAVVKPKVLSVKKSVSSSSGYTDPPDDYDAFLGTSNSDMDKLWEQTSRTPDEVVAWLEKNGLVDFSHLAPQAPASEDYLLMSIKQKNELEEGGEDEDEEEEGPSVTGLSMDEILEECDRQKVGHWDTTYNWGYWGPDMTFGVFSNSSDWVWGEALVVVGLGTSRPGGSYAHAYIVDSLAESAPWWDVKLDIDIETDQGPIYLMNGDTEAYYFEPSDDGRDLLMKAGWDGHQLTIDMLDDLLDWGGSSADRSINL